MYEIGNMAKSKLDDKKGFVYLLRNTEFCKIGSSTSRWKPPFTFKKPLSDERIQKGIRSDLLKRIKVYRTHSPHKVDLLAYTFVNDCMALEETLLKKYARHNVGGEWFSLTQKHADEIKRIFNRSRIGNI